MSSPSASCIMVVNAGSSSVKVQVLAMPSGRLLAKATVDRIGEPEGTLFYAADMASPMKQSGCFSDHQTALSSVLSHMCHPQDGIIESPESIAAVGHRVVQGGETFTKPVIINRQVLEAIEDCTPLAPLHNPANLAGIEVCSKLFPHCPQVAVFDTEFHLTLPESRYLYAVPYDWYSNHRVRKYGFHGTSHKYLMHRYATLSGQALDSVNIITLHLGNGCSMSAIRNGKCIDTSMGMTPLAGLVMGTRSGDLDPAILEYLSNETGTPPLALLRTCNKAAGLLGLSGQQDMRDLREAEKQGDPQASRAIAVFIQRIRHYLGAYIATLGCRPQAILFAGGIGEHDTATREDICKDLSHLGIKLDPEKNNHVRGKEAPVHAKDSDIELYVIPTNEEHQIAKDTFSLLQD